MRQTFQADVAPCVAPRFISNDDDRYERRLQTQSRLEEPNIHHVGLVDSVQISRSMRSQRSLVLLLQG
jgi:hypothetical protein